MTPFRFLALLAVGQLDNHRSLMSQTTCRVVECQAKQEVAELRVGRIQNRTRLRSHGLTEDRRRSVRGDRAQEESPPIQCLNSHRCG